MFTINVIGWNDAIKWQHSAVGCRAKLAAPATLLFNRKTEKEK